MMRRPNSLMMRRPEFLMMRRPEFLMMRRPCAALRRPENPARSACILLLTFQATQMTSNIIA
jgi:hypothetical protein